jgi:hypothetical protein
LKNGLTAAAAACELAQALRVPTELHVTADRDEKRLHFPTKPGGNLRLKMYLDESPGVKVQSLWDDIPPINSQAMRSRFRWRARRSRIY